MRDQFHHVIDVAPTILEAAGIPQPTLVNGVMQTPMEGVSMVYSFDAAESQTATNSVLRDVRQPRHLPPGLDGGDAAPDPWVVDGGIGARVRRRRRGSSTTPTTDWTQAHDLAAELPDVAARAAATVADRGGRSTTCCRWTTERLERALPDVAGRPTLDQRQLAVAVSRNGPLAENSVVNIKNKSYGVTAEIVRPGPEPRASSSPKAASFGGWASTPRTGGSYCYNFLGLASSTPKRPTPAGGVHQVRLEFALRRRGAGQGRGRTLYLDGDKIGNGRVEHTARDVFSPPMTTCDVGMEVGAPIVTRDYLRATPYRHDRWVQIDLDDSADDGQSQLTVDERLQVIMARQ